MSKAPTKHGKQPVNADIIVDNRKLVFGANNGCGYDKVFCPKPLEPVVRTDVLPSAASPVPPAPAPAYSPSSPSYDTAIQPAKSMTLDELCMAMYESPHMYSTNPKSPVFNADDLCQILKRNHVILQPTKALCDLVLQHLHASGYLKRN